MRFALPSPPVLYIIFSPGARLGRAVPRRVIFSYRAAFSIRLPGSAALRRPPFGGFSPLTGRGALRAVRRYALIESGLPMEPTLTPAKPAFCLACPGPLSCLTAFRNFYTITTGTLNFFIIIKSSAPIFSVIINSSGTFTFGNSF